MSEKEMSIRINKMKSIKKLNLPTWSIIALVLSFAILMQIAYIESAHALTKFNRCIVDFANSHGKLSLNDANDCYTKEFKGAQGHDANGQ
ncbi:MAG: hypothetical protein M3Z01_07565 [Thermoproteota archaeon]|nr:hypothetical protein [Thermoproteota archaeon]